MRVLFNLLPTIRPKTGVGHYADHLFAALQTQPGIGVEGFPTPESCARLRGWFRPSGKPVGRGQPWRAAVASTLKRAGRWALNAAFRRASRGFDLVHEPNFIPFDADCRCVVTVHDLSVIRFPAWHPADRVAHHERLFRRTLDAGHDIITVSEAMRRELITYCGVDPRRVVAVQNGTSVVAPTAADCERVRQTFDLPPQYLLSVGTIEPRKNLLLLLQAYCELPAALRERCPLLLAGGWGWKSADVADFLETIARHRNVRHLGYVADADLPGLYRGARALVYPSHYEGFGLPPLEMLALGGAVLASADAAIREVLGPCGCRIDADDRDGWHHALARIIADDDWRAELQHGGFERAKRFSWRRCAAETAALYRHMDQQRVAA